MTTTTVGRLGPQHRNARIEIDGESGILQDVGHYVTEQMTSIRFIGEKQARFRRSDYLATILEIDTPPDDANIDLAVAYDDGALALEAGGWRARRAVPHKVARMVIDSAYRAIVDTLANRIDQMRREYGPLTHDEDTETDGQIHALTEVSDWIRETLPTE